MIYCDLGEPRNLIRTMWGAMILPRYASFTGTNMMPSQVLFKSHRIICEDGNQVYWIKNREAGKMDSPLTEEELKQFMWQKLSTELIR